MTKTVRQLLDQALDLSDVEQQELLAALQTVVEERGFRPFDAATHAEIRRRFAEFTAGKAVLVPWSEVQQTLASEPAERE